MIATDFDIGSVTRPTLLARLRSRGEVAQLVEHTAENRGVAGSSPALAIPCYARSRNPLARIPRSRKTPEEGRPRPTTIRMEPAGSKAALQGPSLSSRLYAGFSDLVRSPATSDGGSCVPVVPVGAYSEPFNRHRGRCRCLLAGEFPGVDLESQRRARVAHLGRDVRRRRSRFVREARVGSPQCVVRDAVLSRRAYLSGIAH